MIAAWLIYASGVGCLIALVALLLERVARWHNSPTRWTWIVAIVSVVALPVVLNLIPRSVVAVHVASSVARSSHAPVQSLDAPLLILWLGASLLLTVRLVGSALALHRRRATWVPIDVDGERVLVAEQLGPAVIGWTKLTMVIPRWAFTLDESARSLMLEHESEHARAGDPHLRMLALLTLVAMPWNPALWWALHRLRLAVEIDCDRRLLARGVDARQYASLLLAVGERISATPFAWATALAGSRSSLETRILAMTSSIRPRYYRVAIGGIGVLAVGIIALACASPVPDSLVPPAAPAGIVAKAAIVTHDSEIGRMVEEICTVGSPCPGGPANLVVYRKTLRDHCEPGTECRKEAEEAGAGGSIRRAGDTVYYYRGAGKGYEPSRAEEAAQQLVVGRLHDAWTKAQDEAVTMSVNGRPVTMKAVADSVRVRP